MHNTRQIFIGAAILIIGLIALVGTMFDVDLGRFLCPTVLILAGVWLLVRPRTARLDTAFTTKLLGDERRSGEWQVADGVYHQLSTADPWQASMVAPPTIVTEDPRASAVRRQRAKGSVATNKTALTAMMSGPAGSPVKW